MYHNLKCRLIVLFCGSLLALSSPVQAGLIASSSALFEDEPGRGSLQILSGPAGSLSAVSYTSTIGLASGGFGHAEYGALHASAEAISAGDTAQTRGQGSASWIDQLTFSSSTLSGSAFARASFSLSGGLSSMSNATGVGALANSTIGSIVSVNGLQVYSSTGQLVSRNGVLETNRITQGSSLNGVLQTDPASTLTGVFSFDIPFVFNNPFQLSGNLTAFVQAMTSSTGDLASAHSNFGSTGTWGGISSVHLADGTVLNDYRLSSDSGFAWSNAFPAVSPVPEPGSLVMLMSGLVCLAGLRRRKKA